MIYLDHNATTMILPEAKDAMCSAVEYVLNASSQHYYGRRAKHMLDSARQSILDALRFDDSFSLIFTATGTEANNIALNGRKVLTSPTEHSSVLNFVGNGTISVDTAGVVDLEHLRSLCRSMKQDFTVSIMAANNETGVIQQLDLISEIVHSHKGLLHTDAAQAVGKIDIDLSVADMISISGHKFGGPLGSAALILKKGIELNPINKGGGQEFRYRPGTHNIPAICGMSKALEIAIEQLQDFAKLSVIRDAMESTIKEASPDAIIFGEGAPRLPNTSSIAMPEVDRQTQVIFFDMSGIAVSAGSACSSGSASIPHVQLGMGYTEDIAKAAIRVSFGLSNTKEESIKFTDKWRELYAKQAA